MIRVQVTDPTRSECTMCSSRKYDPPPAIFEITSDHPQRNSVFCLCEHCAQELVHLLPRAKCTTCDGRGEYADELTGDRIVMCMTCGGSGIQP